MSKFLSSVFLLLLLSNTTLTQVLINVQLPPTGLTVKPQLWNLSLINGSNESISVRVEVIMTDASNNQQVLTGTSNVFVLPVGVKQIQISDVLPISYNITNLNYNVDANPSGFLPIGLFHFCYIVTKVNTDAPERLGEECETAEIEPLSPPQLIVPGDSEEVELSRPLFTWLPPTPFNLFSNLNYDLVIVEVMPFQSGAEAIQQNVPLLNQAALYTSSFQYPLSLPALDSSKTYAWRVSARNNTSLIGNSEVWTFKFKRSSVPDAAKTFSQPYTNLRDEQDASYVISTGSLRFFYLNEINSLQIGVRIFDLTTATRSEVFLDSANVAVQFGRNYIDIDLRTTSGIKDKHIYLIEVTNVKGQRGYLKLEYRKQD